MRTIRTKIYKLSELSKEAKENAHQIYLEGDHEWDWSGEAKDTLEKFGNLFPIEIKNYQIDIYNPSFVNFVFEDTDYNIDELKGIRLLKYLWNNYNDRLFEGRYYNVNSNKPLKHKRVESKTLSNGTIFNAYHSAIQLTNSCVLTGVCFDDDILSPIYDFMNKPDKDTTFYELIEKCFESFINACETDAEYNESFEYFEELAESNEFEYYKDGRPF